MIDMVFPASLAEADRKSSTYFSVWMNFCAYLSSQGSVKFAYLGEVELTMNANCALNDIIEQKRNFLHPF